jgi:hypothetical protein
MGRGPSYPYVGLEDAIALSRKMYNFTKRAPAPVDSIITDAWNYTVTSSSGQKVLAALKAFELVEDAPVSSGKAALKLTDRAIRILLDDQDTQARRDEIRKAALAPKWYEYCWKQWGKEMPASMKSTLLIEHHFVDSTVEGFLKDYRKTMAFAGLLDDVIFGKNDEEHEESKTGPKVGDWVQCLIKGEMKLREPRKLVRIDDDPVHGKFGFIEGQAGQLNGHPYKDIVVAEPPAEESKTKIQPLDLTIPPLGSFSAGIAPSSRGEITMLVQTFSTPGGLTGQVQWPSEITQKAFDGFLRQLADLKINVRDCVRPELPPEVVPSEDGKTP